LSCHLPVLSDPHHTVRAVGTSLFCGNALHANA
jgi:hypothetical protein